MMSVCSFGAALAVAFTLDYPHNVLALAIFIVFGLMTMGEER